jgi:hypothetical protein
MYSSQIWPLSGRGAGNMEQGVRSEVAENWGLTGPAAEKVSRKDAKAQKERDGKPVYCGHLAI